MSAKWLNVKINRKAGNVLCKKKRKLDSAVFVTLLSACSLSSRLRSVSGSKKSHETSRPSSVERPGAVHPWVSAQFRNNNVQPSHPFIQDPTMPPNPAPNPLTQLEEARRRLEEEKKKSTTLQSKQR